MNRELLKDLGIAVGVGILSGIGSGIGMWFLQKQFLSDLEAKQAKKDALLAENSPAKTLNAWD